RPGPGVGGLGWRLGAEGAGAAPAARGDRRTLTGCRTATTTGPTAGSATAGTAATIGVGATAGVTTGTGTVVAGVGAGGGFTTWGVTTGGCPSPLPLVEGL